MIEYGIGDAVHPSQKNSILVHVSNNVGAWGAGFTRAITDRWGHVEQAYRSWFREGSGSLVVETGRAKVGNVQFVPTNNQDVQWVANMIAQVGLYSENNRTPIRYEALRECLRQVGEFCREKNINTVVMPRIGCGLAGGKWEMIEPIIKEELGSLNVIVYDLKKPTE